MKLRNKLLFATMTALFASTTCASPAAYVFTPTVEEGEKEIDIKFGTAKPEGTREQAFSVGFGYGATDYWFTELYVIREREGSEGTSLVEWENKFQLTETGKYPIDIGVIAEIEATLNREEMYELTVGPLFQTEFGKLQLNGNLLFTREFGPRPAGEERVTEFGYQWQIKYRLRPEFEFGAQGMGETGEWNHWEDSDAQNHRIGPAVFGKVDLGNHTKIKYNAAWLVGVSDAAPNDTLRAQFEYEF